jgi:hydroxysqualene dehydroxylase
LIPAQDLSALFPERVQRVVEKQGGEILLGERATTLEALDQGWRVHSASGAALEARHVILACPAPEAARLARTSGVAQAQTWADVADALPHEAITTVYASSNAALPAAVLALRSSETAPAQFVFDKFALPNGRRLWAFVISASHGSADELEAATLAQGAAQLAGLAPGGLQLEAVQTITEKRATFACTPALARPSLQVASRVSGNLLCCADYVDGPYPATLEQAVRHGLSVARAL